MYALVSKSTFDISKPAAIGLCVLFLFTGIGHFVKTDEMIQMVPPWFLWKQFSIYATGIAEILIAIGFLFKKVRLLSAYLGAILLIAFFPVNIYAAMNHVPMGGHAWGPVYLLIRGPVQLIIWFWIYLFVIRKHKYFLKA